MVGHILGVLWQGSSLSSLSLNSLPWGWELLPTSSSGLGIRAAPADAATSGTKARRGVVEPEAPEGRSGVGALRSLPAPPFSLRPPPPPSSPRGRVGGCTNFTKLPKVAGCACEVRRGARRRGTGLWEPWLLFRRPPAAASGSRVVDSSDHSSAARTSPAWRRFPPSEGTVSAAPPSPQSPGGQSWSCG